MTPQFHANSAQPPGKIVALDVGDARIGVATCDPLRLTVRPLLTLRRHSRRRDFEALARIYVEEEAVLVVCGLPYNMDGSEGPQAQKSAIGRLVSHAHFAPSAARRSPSSSGNERLSSFAADEWIAEGGSDAAGQDAVAAAVILRSYLDARHGTGL